MSKQVPSIFCQSFGKRVISLDVQIPPEKVFRVCFWGPNTFSGGVWMSRVLDCRIDR